jgi:hypothetical protein
MEKLQQYRQIIREVITEEVGQLVMRRRPEFKLLVFNPKIQEIMQWIPPIAGTAS